MCPWYRNTYLRKIYQRVRQKTKPTRFKLKEPILGSVGSILSYYPRKYDVCEILEVLQLQEQHHWTHSRNIRINIPLWESILPLKIHVSSQNRLIPSIIKIDETSNGHRKKLNKQLNIIKYYQRSFGHDIYLVLEEYRMVDVEVKKVEGDLVKYKKMKEKSMNKIKGMDLYKK